MLLVVAANSLTVSILLKVSRSIFERETLRIWLIVIGLAVTSYPDTLRQQAIALYQQGKGYKAIGHELGLTRDTVRNWIATYRLTGRTESVQATGQFRNGVKN
ncbi:MAG: helix-turn-helix domain-containing protein [Bacteroidales bacterium]|nr:helix-turn-helix domain-containing protein [Bacteroidales bacterium]